MKYWSRVRSKYQRDNIFHEIIVNVENDFSFIEMIEIFFVRLKGAINISVGSGSEFFGFGFAFLAKFGFGFDRVCKF